MPQYEMQNPKTQTPNDRAFLAELNEYFTQSHGDTVDKLRNFTKFVPRQELARFLAKNELFQRILQVHGHIIECGVFLGAGILTWAQLSAIFEPYNHIRRVVGFDTFEGFSRFDVDKDVGEDRLPHAVVGGLAAPVYDDLRKCVSIYDLNRRLGHIPRIDLVRGDGIKTIPEYVQENRHLVVAMLYLDFDVYEPTKVAIETFLPRMPKGAVIVFDELNQASWPGETLAVLETIGLRKLRIERFPFMPQLSFAVLD